MQAAQIKSYGGQSAISIETTEKPVAGIGEAVIEVFAAGVNPFDYKLRDGVYKDFIKLPFPATLGGDFAGIVSELGPKSQAFEIGQAVFGQAEAASGHGSFAEYTVSKIDHIAAKPKTIDFIEAAALPLAATSAYQAIMEHIKLKSRQKLLIHGGAGGIGSLAIQLAKDLGAFVATTVSTKDVEFVTKLGADMVIDYSKSDFSQKISDFDAVYDMVGGQSNKLSYRVIKEGGILVSMVEQADDNLIENSKVSYIYEQAKPSHEKFMAITDLVDKGRLKIFVDRVFPFGQSDLALEYLKSAHPRGKVVIKIK